VKRGNENEKMKKTYSDQKGVSSMSTMELRQEGPVFVLTLTNGGNANVISGEVLREYQEILDHLEASPNNASLILTSDDRKNWCNGIDLQWLLTKPSEYFPEFADLVDRFLLRFALLNMPTVGCLNGHAFGAGALLATTMDFRIMREDRGFFCFPEVDIGIPFTPLMYDLIRLLPDAHALNELVLMGKRVGGAEALVMKIVSAVYPQEILFEKTMELAAFLAKKDRKTYTHLKLGLRKHLVKLKETMKSEHLK
jgi:enoyl-CoA hydratase/carnithine racemase